LDFLRTRAIPALIALGLAVPAFAADCAAVDGTYQYKAEPGAGMDAATFNVLVLLPQGASSKLFKSEATAQQGFGAGELKSRPKVTPLSSKVKLAYHAGGSQVTFLDADGKALIEVGLNSGGKWACKDGRLERSSERMSGGASGEIRTDRVQQSLQRTGDALVFTETLTTIDPPGGKPRRSETRFKAAR
jgi:hypothetical protein